MHRGCFEPNPPSECPPFPGDPSEPFQYDPRDCDRGHQVLPMPSFLGIGAQKAGTSWLCHWLARHPQIRFPEGKEVHFWDRDHLDELQWYRSKVDPPTAPGIRTGEITPAYAILSAERIREIHGFYPELRLIYLVRNPIERAWSAALMALQRAELGIEEASDEWFIDHFRSGRSRRHGDYAANIRTWESVFPKGQLLILRYDWIKSRPRELLERVANHLDIDGGFFSAFSDEELNQRVFPKGVPASHGHRLRPSLRPILVGLYLEPIRRLEALLNQSLGWVADDEGRAALPVDPVGAEYQPLHRLPKAVQRFETPADSSPRVAICVPILNRGDLAVATLSSLGSKLGGVIGDLYLFDNGSDPDTRARLNRVALPAPHRLTFVRLPENRGLPYVFNLFCRLIQEPCTYTSYTPPDFVMISDADSYLKISVHDLIQVLASNPSIGVVSGHDSVEHPPLATFQVAVGAQSLEAREKTIERGQCLVMRRDDLLACYPLPHHTNLDLDWELMQRHPRSMLKRGRRIVAVDATVHLGLYESTWSPHCVPASPDEIAEIDSTLARCGLLNPERRARRRAYLERYGIPAEDLPAVRQRAAAKPVATGRASAPTFPSPRPHQLIVLGMHRSGTSVVTGCLAHLGLFVGEPDELLSDNAANPTGYWERKDVLNLNQRLLQRHLADAYQIGHLPTGFARFIDEPDLGAHARDIIARLDGQGAWVMKEPRCCLTLPFWAGFLWSAACCIVNRHPLDVAASLWHRDGLPLPYGVALWERYYVEALRNSHGMPRVIVNYQDLTKHPAPTLSRLLQDLLRIGFKLPPPNLSAADHVRGSLHHHQQGSARDPGLLNHQQSRLLAALEDGSALSLGPELEVSPLARETLAAYPQTIDLGRVTDL